MADIYRLILRTQLNRGRAAALVAIAAVGMLLAFAIRVTVASAERAEAAYSLVDGFGLGLLVPTTALVFASAALGDPAEDRTLVYLWLRPIPRWQITAASLAASLSIAVPFAIVPTAVMALLADGGIDLVGASLGAAAAASLAYCAIFLGFGLVVRRALVWGLTYLLIWEGFVARSGTTATRLSVLGYARTLFADLAGQSPPALASSTSVAVAAPFLIGAAAIALTTWLLRRIDVA